MNRFWDNAVVFHFWTYQLIANRETGQRFLDALQRFGITPKKFGDEDPPRHAFHTSSADDLLNLWVKGPGQLVIEKLGVSGFQALVHLSQKTKMPAFVALALDEQYFSSQEKISSCMEFSEELYDIFRPFQGDVGHETDRREKTVIVETIVVKGRTVRKETHVAANPTRGLPGIYWANFFGPIFVDFFLRDKIKSAPSYYKKELPDGGYLVLTSRSPLDYDRPEAKKMELRLIKYLGSDAVFDKTNPDKILRSPFLPDRIAEPSVSKGLASLGSKSWNLRNCPECGEGKNVQETSRDSVNSLLGLRCSKCGARWLVHTSLL